MPGYSKDELKGMGLEDKIKGSGIFGITLFPGEKRIQTMIAKSFTVDSLGSVHDVRVTKSHCASCDTEAVRIVKSMPKWIPAKKEGRPITSEAMVSIPFKLSEN